MIKLKPVMQSIAVWHHPPNLLFRLVCPHRHRAQATAQRRLCCRSLCKIKIIFGAKICKHQEIMQNAVPTLQCRAAESKSGEAHSATRRRAARSPARARLHSMPHLQLDQVHFVVCSFLLYVLNHFFFTDFNKSKSKIIALNMALVLL